MLTSLFTGEIFNVESSLILAESDSAPAAIVKCNQVIYHPCFPPALPTPHMVFRKPILCIPLEVLASQKAWFLANELCGIWWSITFPPWVTTQNLCLLLSRRLPSTCTSWIYGIPCTRVDAYICCHKTHPEMCRLKNSRTYRLHKHRYTVVDPFITRYRR